MDEIVKLVARKAGISEKQARQAVQTVMGYVDDKLPAPIAKQVTKLMESGEAGGLEEMVKGLDLGSLFGDRK